MEQIIPIIQIYKLLEFFREFLKKWNRQFSLVRGNEGEELFSGIRLAQKSIMMTTFSNDMPTARYIDLLLSALDRGVTVTRVIPKSIENEKFDWLTKFKDKPLYTETITDQKLPFDIYIFDGKTTRLYFPVDTQQDCFKDGLELVDQEVSTMFQTALQRIIIGRTS
ncbi:MAG: hypothetical protein PHQ03_01200 [Methylococcales bacterium]|nr:hypothetical protein [Methylococcales bacterium]